MPQAFSVEDCERILAGVASAPKAEARLVGQNRDPERRRADLVWIDDVEGMGWVMDRLIDLVRCVNRDQFGYDLRDFGESPQIATYRAKTAGHFAWHSDIGDGPLARQRKLTLVLQLSTSASYEGGDLQVMPSAHVMAADRGKAVSPFSRALPCIKSRPSLWEPAILSRSGPMARLFARVQWARLGGVLALDGAAKTVVINRRQEISRQKNARAAENTPKTG